ncbi:MAG: SMP-30/gluconolactonase/LRE family protein [Dehalococcoidia bacterium]|nr:SMP-30/gluconolactonase/LRE family protein [Dehalococcoidia bacterium]
MATNRKPDVLLDGLKFTEAPRWHGGKLWFSDFYLHAVMTVSMDGHAERVLDVPAQPSGLGWAPDGALLVVSMLDHRLLRADGSSVTTVADLSAYATGPCNDMVVDHQGRAYIGNFGFDREKGEEPRTTVMVRVDPDGTISVAADELLFPNGTVITPDGRTLITGETFGRRLSAFDIEAGGSLTNRRVFAQFDDVYPDGICLDTEGAIWVADPVGRRVVRVVEGGGIKETIAIEDGTAFACMLGGPDRQTLFICTGSGSGAAAAATNDARIETIRVDVPGAGLP